MAKEPVEFVKLNFDFHPQWMGEQFSKAGLQVQQQLAVSHFRTPILKRSVSAATLAKVDSWLFSTGGIYPLAPSVFVQVGVDKEGEKAQASPNAGGISGEAVSKNTGSTNIENGIERNKLADLTELFSCPACGGERTLTLEHETQLTCRQCSKQYAKRDGIWDFKESLEG